MEKINELLRQQAIIQAAKQKSETYVITLDVINKMKDMAEKSGNLMVNLTHSGMGPIVKIKQQWPIVSDDDYIDITGYDNF